MFSKLCLVFEDCNILAAFKFNGSWDWLTQRRVEN